MKYDFYLAASLFTEAECGYNLKIAKKIQKRGYTIFLPQIGASPFYPDKQKVFDKCLEGLAYSKRVLALLEGTDTDSGLAFELGYAYANKIPIFGIRTDLRHGGDSGNGLNLMIDIPLELLTNDINTLLDYMENNGIIANDG